MPVKVDAEFTFATVFSMSQPQTMGLMVRMVAQLASQNIMGLVQTIKAQLLGQL